MQLLVGPVHGPRGEEAGRSDGERPAEYVALILRPPKITDSIYSRRRMSGSREVLPPEF